MKAANELDASYLDLLLSAMKPPHFAWTCRHHISDVGVHVNRCASHGVRSTNCCDQNSNQSGCQFVGHSDPFHETTKNPRAQGITADGRDENEASSEGERAQGQRGRVEERRGERREEKVN